jgi:hypothetical protein
MGSKTTTIRSAGEPSMRGHACFVLPEPEPEPGPEETARVVITDPRSAATRSGPPSGSGPRNPAQAAWRAPQPPGVELPDGLPLTKAQRFWIDPELLAAWEDEERRKQAV